MDESHDNQFSEEVVMRKPGKKIRNTNGVIVAYVKHFCELSNQQCVVTPDDVKRISTQARDMALQELHPDKVMISFGNGNYSMCLSKTFFE